MSVARTHHTEDYTCMSNHHFKDKRLSLKAKGLLSLMLSLPDTWDYNIKGLATLSSDGETAVRSAVTELEDYGYVKRTPIRVNGRIADWEYDIYELPLVENPQVENPLQENKDNKILKNQILIDEIKTISKDIVQTPTYCDKIKPKKKNLYEQCIDLINDFTEDEILREYLVQFLKICLENF